MPEPKPEPEEPKEPTLDEQVQDATKEHVEGTAKVIKMVKRTVREEQRC